MQPLLTADVHSPPNGPRRLTPIRNFAFDIRTINGEVAFIDPERTPTPPAGHNFPANLALLVARSRCAAVARVRGIAPRMFVAFGGGPDYRMGR